MMKEHYELSYPVGTVSWNGKNVVRLPQEAYEPQFRLLKSVGIDRVMLTGYVTVEEADFDVLEETKRLGGYLDSLGMRPAQHHGLAASYAPIGVPQEPVVERLRRSVLYTANLNSPVLVIHPGHYYHPESWNKVTLQEMFDRECDAHGVDAVLETAARNLHEAGAYAEKLGVRIAVENVDRFEPMGRVGLLDRLVALADSPAVGFCLDTGHAHCCGLTTPLEWMDIMGTKLFTTHVHDNRGARLQAATDAKWIAASKIDEHRPPGFGTIPWLDVIRKLREIGYEEVLNFESGGWGCADKAEGYRHAIAFWRECERISLEG